MSMMDFETARHNMVENQVRCCKILDPALLETFGNMPREEFLPDEVKSLAYMEGRVPLPCGQEMLSPLQEGHIMQSLDLNGDERILEIGAGCGFLTALLATSGGEVVALELHRELADMAAENLQKHGITNAIVRCANGMDEAVLGELGSFDAIVVGAAVRELPQALTNMLNEGGRLVFFEGENPLVKLVCLRRDKSGALVRDEILETLLQSVEGIEKKREFIF